MLPEMWGYDAGPKKQEIALTPTILELRDENDHGIEGWIDGSRSHTLDAFALSLFFFFIAQTPNMVCFAHNSVGDAKNIHVIASFPDIGCGCA